MYWRNDSPAAKMALMAIPASTMVSGVQAVNFTSRRIMPVAIMAKMNATAVTRAGLSTERFRVVVPEMSPPPRNMMATAAPKADALDIPRV